MFELYFIFYRVPKMMSRLAREHNRSALAWSLIGIVTWIVVEFAVGFGLGLLYILLATMFDWPAPSAVFRLLSYVLALVAALGGVTVVSRLLTNKSKPRSFPAPPPPPSFTKPETRIS